MTIASFCRDQLLTDGPLPLSTLAGLAAAAGRTTAKDPAASVRGAIAYTEVELADGRWATPMWLLEGRILTVRRLPIGAGGAGLDVGRQYDALMEAGLYLEDPDDEDHLGGARHDIALLDLAARSRPLPLASGGTLRSSRYHHEWRVPQGWPEVRPGRGELLGLRVRGGELHVELVPVTGELCRAGQLLAQELGPLDARGRYWSAVDSLVSQNLVAALWNRMAVDPTFLTSPVPPLSQCVPPLADALQDEAERRAEQAQHWRPQLDLPSALQDIAVRAARREDQLLDEWLQAFIVRSLLNVPAEDDGAADEVLGNVLPLQRQRSR